MPIYAYRCEGCGFQKDALQKLSDPPLVDCPQCGQPRLVKQVTAAGFALKGSGWYVTDFRDSGKKPPAAQANKPDASGADSASASASTGSAEGPSAPPAGSAAAASPASAPAAAAAPAGSNTPAASGSA